jgi:hypothetical protein
LLRFGTDRLGQLDPRLGCDLGGMMNAPPTGPAAAATRVVDLDLAWSEQPGRARR